MTTKPGSTLEVLKLHPDARLPVRAHPGDAGLDLHGLEDVELGPAQGKVLRTGVAVAVPAGHVGMIADRSSMAKRGLKVAGGIVDSGYRGEVGVVLWNVSSEPVRLKAGDRIAQLLVLPIAVPEVRAAESLDGTARGAGGFGSTGK
jgi:dUTP pyrophosphatase